MTSTSHCCVQARHYQGVSATSAVEAVIRCLVDVGRLPKGYSLGMPRCHVPSNPCSLIGRAEEVQQVLKSLQEHRCVIISGGPGEGKTALAQKVVWDMWERGELPGGAYPVNLAGTLVNRPECQCSSGTFRIDDEALPCTGVFQSALEQDSTDLRSIHMSQALADLLLSSLSVDQVGASNLRDLYRLIEDNIGDVSMYAIFCYLFYVSAGAG